MRAQDKWLLGMDLHIGSVHGFKYWGSNSWREFLFCVRGGKYKGEKGRCDTDGMQHFSVLNNHDPKLLQKDESMREL